MTETKTSGAGRHPSRDDSGWSEKNLRDAIIAIAIIAIKDGATVTHKELDLKWLGKLLNRKLTDGEIKQIAHTLTTFLTIKNTTNTITNQEVIATLKAIASGDDEMVIQDFENCDNATVAQIEQAIFCDMRIKEFDNHPPERIRAAAKLALSSLPPGEDGTPGIGYRSMFYQAVLRLWNELGGEVTKGISEKSPLVQFAWNLLGIIEPKPPTLSVIAKALRKARKVLA